MKKHLKSLLVFMLVVPCLVLFSACGAPTKMADGGYALESLSIKMPGMTASINFPELFEYMGDDFNLEEMFGDLLEEEGEGEDTISIIEEMLPIFTGGAAIFTVNGNKLSSPIFGSENQVEYTLTKKGIIKIGDEEFSFSDEKSGMSGNFKYTKNKITLTAEFGEDIKIELVLKKVA